MTLGLLRVLQRGLFGNSLAIDTKGHAVIETIVSTPNAETRTSWRYRANATFSVDGFTIETPQLVEQYQETCYGVSGCYEMHWTCQRAK
jgi:hypothetical protein